MAVLVVIVVGSCVTAAPHHDYLHLRIFHRTDSVLDPRIYIATITQETETGTDIQVNIG